MNQPIFACVFGCLIVACSAKAPEGAAVSEGAFTTPPPVIVLDCIGSPSAPSTVVAQIDVSGPRLTMKDAAGTAIRGATLDPDYHPHGTSKVRYLIDESAQTFSSAEFEWNQIMIDQSTLDTGSGQVTLREDAGDRSDWRYLQCSKATSMPSACRIKLLREMEGGSVQASPQEILAILEHDWSSPGETVHYEDCGASDYYYITVRKSDCAVLEAESGNSDGECR